MRHPAKYTDSLIPIFAELLQGTRNVLDPFAGTGKLVGIRDYGYTGEIWLNELEAEWALQTPSESATVVIGDAERLLFDAGYFDAICTSPTYGNRMADHHNAKDGSRRNTYTHAIGRKLTEGNTGAMQWGDEYRAKHERIWRECTRVLRPGGLFVLNISDHIRGGKVMPVTDWHIRTLEGLGYTVQEHRQVKTPRQRFGANGHLRVEYESVVVLRAADSKEAAS